MLLRRSRNSMRVLTKKISEQEKAVSLALLSCQELTLENLIQKTGLEEKIVSDILQKLQKEGLLASKFSWKSSSVAKSTEIDFAFRPRMAETNQYSQIEEGLMLSTNSGNKLCLSPIEEKIVGYCNGHYTIKEIVIRVLLKEGFLVLPEQIGNLLSKIEDTGGLANFGRTIYKPYISRNEKYFNLLEIKLWEYTFAKDGYFQKTGNLLKVFFSDISFFIGLALFFCLAYPFIKICSDISISYLFSTWRSICLFYIVSIFCIFLHECAHALCLAAEGGSPGKFSMILFNFVQFAFAVDVSDIWTLSRKSRLKVLSAGLHLNLFLSILGFIIVSSHYSPEWLVLVGFQIIFISYPGILFNLCPFLRTDGYYILSQIMSINHLRKKCFAMVFPSLKKGLCLPKDRSFRLFSWFYVIFSLLYLISGILSLFFLIFKIMKELLC